MVDHNVTIQQYLVDEENIKPHSGGNFTEQNNNDILLCWQSMILDIQR